MPNNLKNFKISFLWTFRFVQISRFFTSFSVFTLGSKLGVFWKILGAFLCKPSHWLWLDLDTIINPFWKVDLDCQSQIHYGFGLDWKSEKMDWATPWVCTLDFKSNLCSCSGVTTYRDPSAVSAPMATPSHLTVVTVWTSTNVNRVITV